MKDLFKMKDSFMIPLIKLVIRHPRIKESKIFLKAMAYFPGKVSGSYDNKIVKSEIYYKSALLDGLSDIRTEPKEVLDICTGTGFAAFLLAKAFPKAKIEAVDLSPEMIKISREKLNNYKNYNIDFRVGNAMKLDYNDNEFDLVVTSNAPVYLEEAVRVLKPRGEILAVFSFGGEAFEGLRDDVARLLENNWIELEIHEGSDKGVFIIGRKSD